MDGKRKEQKTYFSLRLNETGKLKGQELCGLLSLIWSAMLLPP